MAPQNSNSNSFHLIQSGISSILKKNAAGNASAILFGSRARGEAHNGSDWDILILIDKDKITRHDIDAISFPIRELGWDIDEVINPIIYTQQEWDSKSFTPFYKNVTKDGIKI